MSTSFSRDRNTSISKNLSRILRHQAAKMGFQIGSDGFIAIDELLRHRDFRGVTLEDIRSIVANCEKKRFEIQMKDGVESIRAAQGHTMKSVNDEELLTRITDASTVPVCIHGTYDRFLGSIMETGLNRMQRNHIHFATGMPSDGEVISGMRKSCQVVIVVNVEKAMRDGIVFYRSSNNVILSSGIDGVISPVYFKEVIRRGNSNTQKL